MDQAEVVVALSHQPIHDERGCGIREMKKILNKVIWFILIFASVALAETRPNDIITLADKGYLLNLARQTVLWHLKYDAAPQPLESELNDRLRQKLGCFVTLEHKVKGLRGCIGIFERDRPLVQNVVSRAVAAVHDFRFQQNPVTFGELKDIRIEISVLTEPRNLAFTSPEDLLAKLKPGIDGVILTTRYGTSTFLPQVWEHFSKKEDFLGHLCEKHGAPMNTWMKDYRNVRIDIYQALVFGEEVTERMVAGPRGAVVGKKGATLLGAVTPLPEATWKSRESLKEGTWLAPGAIVTWDSDILEPNQGN